MLSQSANPVFPNADPNQCLFSACYTQIAKKSARNRIPRVAQGCAVHSAARAEDIFAAGEEMSILNDVVRPPYPI